MPKSNVGHEAQPSGCRLDALVMAIPLYSCDTMHAQETDTESGLSFQKVISEAAHRAVPATPNPQA